MGALADKGANAPSGSSAMGAHTEKGSPTPRHIVCSVLEHYGWRHVEDNFDTFPPVADFPPSEWVNLLSLEDRAALAGVCVNYNSAASVVNAIDASRPSSSITASETQAIVNYIEAKSMMQDTVAQLQSSVLAVLAKSFPFDPGGSRSCNLQFCNISSIVRHAPVPYRRKRLKVVDICSGQQSLAKFILLLDPTAEVLSLDIIGYRQALSELPAHLHHRVKYVEFNVAHLTFDKLRQLVREHLKCDIKDLYCIHFSPCCKSYSSADAGKSGYRLADGTPNPSPRRSDGSINHDCGTLL